MNAEALVGTVLGTCTLQQLVGQGGMGAVFLAQQSRPRRQVAVKVLLPMTPLNASQLAAFLERFRRETDAAASLEHPNIMPVHEYGERNGLAYLVMPYISGGTLRDEMEREGPLSLEKVVLYLDQMAAALDCAHERGVIHRDVKPANILMTPEGRLLLTDFGLVKIIAEGQTHQVRLTGEGAPVGTPDYMSPEQVLGEGVDTRADLYSLGIILYQMVTGTTPFQGETPMQIAAQHLQVPPPPPQLLRPDLPVATEQVILQALAKRPLDRYATAQELATAFRSSLIGTGIQLGFGQPPGSLLTSATYARLAIAKGKAQQSWQTGMSPAVGMGMGHEAQEKERDTPTGTGYFPAVDGVQLGRPTLALPSVRGSGLLERATATQRSVETGALPSGNTESVRSGGGLLSKTGKFPQVGTDYFPAIHKELATSATNTDNITNTAIVTPQGAAQVADVPSVEFGQLSPVLNNTTGSLAVPEQRRNTIKLTEPMKVVKVPVAGQPGHYVTGLLPVASPVRTDLRAEPQRQLRPWVKMMSLVMAVLLVAMGALGIFWFVRTHPGHTVTPQATHVAKPAGTPNVQATAMAQATATADGNIILSDPLSTNTHNWLTTPTDVYAFKDGAYHITDRGNNGRATILQGSTFTQPLEYQLTMEEIGGDDTNASNSFGMILRFNQQTVNKKTVTTFYSFEVVNTKGGEYQFWKYDDSKTTIWTEIWHQRFAAEFHQGHGDQAINTFRIFANGSKFEITVNGKAITTAQNDALTGGTIGMIVNLNGTEVAFKNLLLVSIPSNG